MKRIMMILACALLVCGGVWAAAQRAQKMDRARVAERVKGLDKNGDGKVSKEEFTGPAPIFQYLDANADGAISAEELKAFAQAEGPMPFGPGSGREGRKKDAATELKPVGGISAEVKALSEMTAEDRYKGEDGGLYGKGKNTPPAEQMAAAMKAAQSIQPLDPDGKPAKDGKAVFISFGMSNTTQEFQVFQKLIGSIELSPSLVVVDCAQGGMESRAWGGDSKTNRRAGQSPWEVLELRLKSAGVTPLQVQAAWVKLAMARPAPDGEYPAHIKKFQEYTLAALQRLKTTCPNLKLAYISNRIYAGYAVSELNPEPYSYEYCFGIRGMILKQIAGDPEYNFVAQKGAVKLPVLLWGPDLWANGERARKDGLKWSKDELGPDGTHPSDAGRLKVAKMLLNFLKTDPTAKIWFK